MVGSRKPRRVLYMLREWCDPAELVQQRNNVKMVIMFPIMTPVAR